MLHAIQNAAKYGAANDVAIEMKEINPIIKNQSKEVKQVLSEIKTELSAEIAPLTEESVEDIANLAQSDQPKTQSKAKEIAKAAIVQAVGTSLTFGSKAFVEAMVKTALSAGADSDQPEVKEQINQVAGAVGGLYVGAIHGVIGAASAKTMGQLFQMPSFTNQSTSFLSGQISDSSTIDLPVMGAFSATYAAKAAISNIAKASNPFLAAAANATASILGGVIQGGITHMMKDNMSDIYARKEFAPKNAIDMKDVPKEFIKNVGDGFNKLALDDKQLRMTAVKMAAGTGGMLIAGTSADAISNDFDQLAKCVHKLDQNLDLSKAHKGANVGAGAMMAFLTTWFGAQRATQLAEHVMGK